MVLYVCIIQKRRIAMDKKLYIQTYSVRDRMDTYEQQKETYKKLASYGYAGIQLAGDGFGWDNYKKACDEAGLKIIGGHIKYDYFFDEAKIAEISKALGTNILGIGGFPAVFAGEKFTEENFLESVKALRTICENCKKNGVRFSYHHHSCEFAKIKGEFLFDIIKRELDPQASSFVLDTYWVVHAGIPLYELMKSLEGRIDILHLKDKKIDQGFMDGHITELGAGTLDFKEIIKIADSIGVKYLCYEQDNGFSNNDSLDSAKASAEYFYSIV